MKLYDKLCSPAKLYFVISAVSYLFILFQNIGNPSKFTLGNLSCSHSNVPAFLIMQALYILFWTWLLQLICKINKTISWVIVLFPYILFLIAITIVLVQGMSADKEGMGSLSQYTI